MDLITPGFGLIFWQTVVFLGLVLVLSKYAWKPMLEAIKKRETSIAESLSSAEKARDEMAKLKSDNEKLLEEARLERDEILKEALATANNIKQDAKTDATKVTGKMIEDARNSIEGEKQAAISEMKEQIASLSVQIAEKLLRRNLANDQSHRELVEQFIKDVNTN